jgi:alpha-1,3-glucosyltransferase
MSSTRNAATDEDESAENRMATLLLLAKGQAPSWSRLLRPSAQQQPRQKQQTHSSASFLRHQQQYQQRGLIKRRRRWVVIAYLWIISVATKILLFPAYKSTDFYVHRHWKAVTRNLPVSQWYYDDQHVDTVHTLDYPPGFALAEYILANNPMTTYWLPRQDDGECLALKKDAEAYATTSPRCVAYMRVTVIVADAVWWLAAYFVARTTCIPSAAEMTLFGVLTYHPALLWLDNVHFQYNGLLLGILFFSIGLLMHANNNNNNTTAATTRTMSSTTLSGTHFYHLTAAAVFALLLTLKHLYLTNGLWYAVYLLRRFCYERTVSSSDETVTTESLSLQRRLAFSWQRFLALAVVSVITAAVPCLVFVGALLSESPPIAKITDFVSFKQGLAAWTTQVKSRMFPFARGLVLAYKSHSERMLHLVSYVSISPGATALCILIAQIPSLRLAWKAASERSNTLLLQSFTMASLATFLFQYHAHEKAILTALIPCTVWAFATAAKSSSAQQQQPPPSDNSHNKSNAVFAPATTTEWILLWVFTAVSLLGLFPLLYQPQELLLKLCSSTVYLTLLMHLCPSNKGSTRQGLCLWIGSIVVTTMAQLELAPLGIFGRYEFAPLAVTSLVCAAGYLWLFARLCYFA